MSVSTKGIYQVNDCKNSINEIIRSYLSIHPSLYVYIVCMCMYLCVYKKTLVDSDSRFVLQEIRIYEVVHKISLFL